MQVMNDSKTAGRPPTLTILYMYCTGGTECLSRTPGSHSVCAVRTLLGVNQKNSLHLISTLHHQLESIQTSRSPKWAISITLCAMAFW